MPFPKLTPLQCRFMVSLTASMFLVVIYYFLWNPHFAYAAEIETPANLQHVDYRRGIIRGDEGYADMKRDVESNLDLDSNLDWDAHFDLDEHDEQQHTKRATGDIVALGGSNIPGLLNIQATNNTIWTFSNTSLWGAYANKTKGLPSKLQDGDTGDAGTLFKREEHSGNRTVFISITTCLQPLWNASAGNQTTEPPQLTLYVSNSTKNKEPGPRGPADSQIAVKLFEGFANYSMNVSDTVYMSVSAPDMPQNFAGIWNYEIAASIDDYYHAAHPGYPFLFLVDTDTHAALLVTDNLTQARPEDTVFQKWMNSTAPFTVFAQPITDRSLDGMRSSYCGMTHASINNASSSVQSGMITRGMGNKPKEQFYIQNLNASTSYFSVLAMEGNSTDTGPGVVGGGGQIWQPVSFTTKAQDNCALVFNLTFCNEVAYAVPSNPNNYPDQPSLSAVYDSYAYALYQNFSKSLAQIPCNTTSSAQYSLAKTCDDCADAYKQWLCAVTMPRCEDFSSTLPWLQPRNMGQAPINITSQQSLLVQEQLNEYYIPMPSAPSDSEAFKQTYGSVFASNHSRNPEIIDYKIQPGPYKEVKPCTDLCYSLVQSCPAALGFSCPNSGRGLEVDYGQRSKDGQVTCSYLGAVYYLNAAAVSTSPLGLALLVAASLSLWLFV